MEFFIIADSWKTKQKGSGCILYISTLFIDKKDKNWNSDIYNPITRKDVIEKAVANQASAWVKAANLYVPFYRQAHYRIFVEPYAIQGKQAG